MARVLRLEMQSLPLRGGNELETAFQAASMEGAEALLVLPDPLTLSHGSEIVRLAAQYRLPALYGASDIVTEEGRLMSLAADRFGMMRRTGFYVDRILTGTSPAELPIDQATRFELVINLRTAQALGLTVPSELLLDATEDPIAPRRGTGRSGALRAITGHLAVDVAVPPLAAPSISEPRRAVTPFRPALTEGAPGNGSGRRKRVTT